MKIFSINQKFTEKNCGITEENILLSLTDEEWKGEEFRYLPHHRKVAELSANTTGVFVQLFGDCVLGTLLILQKGNEKGRPQPLSFYFTENRFYFIGNPGVIEKLLHRANKSALPENTSALSILGVFINLLVDEDTLFFTGLESSLEKIEEAVLEKQEAAMLTKLNVLRKELRAYKTLYMQLANVSLNLKLNAYGMLSPEQCTEYEHLGLRATLMSEHIKDLTEYALQIRDIYQAQIDMKQTRAMNMLTIVSAIFLPLTLITGWYGMNFSHMSELTWAFSYPAVFIAAVVIVVTEIFIFWKKGLFK